MQHKFFYTLLSVFIISISGLSQKKNIEYYITAGINNSPLLKDYNNQKLSNVIDSMKILSGYKPQIIGVSTNIFAPYYKGWGYDATVTNSGIYEQLVTFNQRLVSKKNLANQYEAIKLLNESLTISGKITEQDLRKTITAQYITTYGDWLQIKFNKEINTLLRKEALILKKQAEKGIYRQTDYLGFLVTTQQQELFITQITNQYKYDFAALNYLCALKDTNTVELEEPLLHISVAPDAEGTIFYKQLTIDSLKIKNNAARLDFSYKPKVGLYADAGYLTSFAYQAYKNFGTSFGISVTVPIYDGNQRQLLHRKLNIAEQTREGYRDYFKNQFDQQIQQLSQQLHAAQEIINQASEQIKYTETLIEANKKLLETGEARMPDYILAIGNYLTTKNIITQNNITKLQIINQINYWNRN